MNILSGGLIGAVIILAGLWQWEAHNGDKAREDKATAEAMYAAEVKTAGDWRDFAERRAREAQDANQREGQAARSETERQQQLTWAYRQIEDLQNETRANLAAACGDTIVRDADANQLYNDALDAIANGTAAARDPASLPSSPSRVDGPAD